MKTFILAYLALSVPTEGLFAAGPRRVVQASTRSIEARRGDMMMRKGRPSTRLVPKGSGKSSSPTPNWVQIYDSEEKLTSLEDGKGRVIQNPTNPSKQLMVLKRGEKVYALSASCTKCKFPLLNSEFDDAESSIVCPVCGSKFSLKSGAPTGRIDKQGVAGLFSSVMSSSPGGAIEAYEVRQAPNGRVYAAIGMK